MGKSEPETPTYLMVNTIGFSLTPIHWFFPSNQPNGWNPINNGMFTIVFNWWFGFRWPIHSINHVPGLVICYIANWNMAVEIVSFPIAWWCSSSFFVCLEGIITIFKNGKPSINGAFIFHQPASGTEAIVGVVPAEDVGVGAGKLPGRPRRWKNILGIPDTPKIAGWLQMDVIWMLWMMYI